MRLTSRISVLLAAALLASPAASQGTQPIEQVQLPPSTAPAVPPAPPPDLRTAPEAPPPFAPMPRAAPRHRWIDMGSERKARAHHRSATRRHHVAARKHKVTRAHGPSRAEIRKKKDLRWCQSKSHRQVLRHARCKMVLKQHRKEVARHHAERSHHAKSRHHAKRKHHATRNRATAKHRVLHRRHHARHHRPVRHRR